MSQVKASCLLTAWHSLFDGQRWRHATGHTSIGHCSGGARFERAEHATEQCAKQVSFMPKAARINENKKNKNLPNSYFYNWFQSSQISWLTNVDQPKGERIAGTGMGQRFKVEKLRKFTRFINGEYILLTMRDQRIMQKDAQQIVLNSNIMCRDFNLYQEKEI